MGEILYGKLQYIGIILVCLISAGRIVTGTGNTIMREYGKLADEEKQLYDISKVKMSQILYVLSLVLLTILAFIFSEIFPNIISTNTIIMGYLAAIVVLLIFVKTKWILNGFCKKK